MKRTLFAVAATAALGMGIGIAEAAQPPKFGKLDHVFVIIMENQTDTDIVGNTNAPFINSYRNVANEATNYFAVGHPSAPNYLRSLEVRISVFRTTTGRNGSMEGASITHPVVQAA